jgi:WD40 repeat protein
MNYECAPPAWMIVFRAGCSEYQVHTGSLPTKPCQCHVSHFPCPGSLRTAQAKPLLRHCNHQAVSDCDCEQVWDLERLCCVATWTGHSKPVLKLQSQGKYVFSIGGLSVRVWDTQTGECVQRLLTTRSAGTLRSLCVSPSMQIVVGCQDTTIKLYQFLEPDHGDGLLGTQASTRPGNRADDVECMVEPSVTGSLDEGHCAAVQSVVHSHKYIISAGGDCRIRVWRKDDLSIVCALPGHRGPIFALLVAGARFCHG